MGPRTVAPCPRGSIQTASPPQRDEQDERCDVEGTRLPGNTLHGPFLLRKSGLNDQFLYYPVTSDDESSIGGKTTSFFGRKEEGMSGGMGKRLGESRG